MHYINMLHLKISYVFPPTIYHLSYKIYSVNIYFSKIECHFSEKSVHFSDLEKKAHFSDVKSEKWRPKTHGMFAYEWWLISLVKIFNIFQCVKFIWLIITRMQYPKNKHICYWWSVIVELDRHFSIFDIVNGYSFYWFETRTSCFCFNRRKHIRGPIWFD